MRCVEVRSFGGPEVLQLREAPEPRPPEDGYVVEVHAVGCNYAEVVQRRGRYARDQQVPARLGKEAAGVVVARGPSASRFAVGDPVIVVRFDDGCYAERVAARDHQVLRPPAGFTFPEMAAFGIAWLTGWWALHEQARVRPGESILVQAAAGGVGTATVALARTAGMDPVIGTAGGPAKLEVVRGVGADLAVDYTADPGLEAVDERTGGRGVDVVLESVGGRAFTAALSRLAPGGRLVVIGFSSIREGYGEVVPRVSPLSLFHRSASVGGLNIDHLEVTRRLDVWDRLVAHVEAHGLRPLVGLTLPLEQVADAHAALEDRATVGKVVLTTTVGRAATRPRPRRPVDIDLTVDGDPALPGGLVTWGGRVSASPPVLERDHLAL